MSRWRRTGATAERLRHDCAMAWRRLFNDRAYSLIAIGGLALGLAGCLMIWGYVRYERGYDAWVPGADRVYQVQSSIRAPGQPEVHTQTSSYIIYDRFPADFPQVEAVTSLAMGKTVTERDGRPEFIDASTVDPSFFRVFPLPFLHGSPATALSDTHAIVLSRSEAVRRFGSDDVLGRTLTLGAGDGRTDYRVGGVLKDLPPDTNLKLALVMRRDIDALPPERRSWGDFGQQHFVRLRPGADVAALNAALPKWEERVIPVVQIEGKPAKMSDAFDFRLTPLTDVHLGQWQDGATVPGGDPRTLATFGIVALLTLAMATINFVNLATARAASRAREVGLRKVMGATRRQLVIQFLIEGLLVCAIATLLAFALVELVTPAIAALVGADLRVAYLGNGGMLLPAAALLAVTGALGAAYPAVVISRFRPADVLRAGRGSAETSGGVRLRAVLVVTQFAVAIGLIASTAVIWSQTRFVQKVDPGFRRDGLVQIANAWRFTQGVEYEAAAREILAIPGVTSVGRARLAAGDADKNARLVRWPGAPEYQSLGVYAIDAHLLQTMGVERLAGRLLGDRFAADRLSADATADALRARGLNIVINRTALRVLGVSDPALAVGRGIELEYNGAMVPVTIVGVVGDTRYRTAREAVQPMIYLYQPTDTATVLVRYTAARPGEVMAGLARVWRRFEPEIPFEARFVDDIVREQYAAERARTLLFAGFSALAVVIACLGLYSLAAFTTERRTKEIGIRKVLGATVRHIVQLLAWQFSKPVVLANLIAWPVAWWAMRDWLNGFDARIALGPTPFALAGLLALAIALLTVAGHAVRVARLNPIHALRYE